MYIYSSFKNFFYYFFVLLEGASIGFALQILFYSGIKEVYQLIKKLSPSKSDPLIWAVKGKLPFIGKTTQFTNGSNLFSSWNPKVLNLWIISFLSKHLTNLISAGSKHGFLVIIAGPLII